MIENLLERIAVALEKIAESAEAPVASAEEPAAKPPSSSKKSGASSKKSTTQSRKTSATEKSATEESEGTEFKIEDVRKALMAVQKAHDPATAKALLKKFGAVTLSKLKPENFGPLIAEAEELTDE